jgi:ABC-type thiamine transport system substrate-binding protein
MKLLVLALAFAALGAQDKPPRVLDLLEESGHQYEKAGSGFAVKFNGNNQKDIRIIVVQAGAVVVLGSVLATKDDIADAAGLQQALLNANDDYDYVKTTIDNDGDYAIRADLLAAGLTGQRLADQLVQIATATDLLKPIVDKYRKKP